MSDGNDPQSGARHARHGTDPAAEQPGSDAPTQEFRVVVPPHSADQPARHAAPQEPPTQAIPVQQPLAQAWSAAPEPEQLSTQTQPPAEVPTPDAPPPRRKRPRFAAFGLIAAAVLAVFALAYATDWFTSAGKVPRGVDVAGVALGGKSIADADAVLRDRVGSRIEQPLQAKAGSVQAELLPKDAGLGVDWNATLDHVGSQPINPITRITSFFTSRDVDLVPAVDRTALTAAVEKLRSQVDRAPVEGNVVFEGAKAVGVKPVDGQKLDVDGAKSALIDEWASNAQIDLPVTVTDVSVDQAAVDKAVAEVAGPAVANDLVFTGKNGKNATLAKDQVGAVLKFAPDGKGGLAPQFDRAAATGILAPQLADTEIEPKDATISVAGGSPAVLPAVVGDLVQWQKTLDPLPALLAAPAPRTVAAVYEPVPPKLTTEGANALGIKEVIGEFTTGGFESASGVNIRLVAQDVNGAIVKPGDTFSLNGYTGPRGEAQGYVPSGIIDHGRPSKAVGGGISQFATTLYNASYFAGLEDVEHTEHSYYIKRYPEAREATVFEGAIDLQFRNNTKTGILIQSSGTSSDVTVRIWGTKTVDVESITGDRTKETEPESQTLPKGDDCIPSTGAPGFTASNTRVITDHATGQQISTHTRTVKYDPVPIIKCE
ncbi:VanW family protein [Antrihabitans cavernicola]|uniref:VanW family protein n=1 Tax=Antrihabitans cavernicola TaxID=2495913 RepID=UPI001F47C0A7|nr:VanW family protein [Spelaeibacter cavernicola]